MPLTHHLLLALTGVAAGFLNVMAGGGSLLIMPVMVLMGLPGPVANGTTRVAILAQNVSATAGFRRLGLADLKLSLSLSACALPGAVVGAYLGTRLQGVWFNRVLAGVMIVVLALMALGRRAPSAGSDPPVSRARFAAGHALMVAAGLYGGFIQAGVGFIIMAILHRVLGLDLVRVNMHKVFAIGTYTIAAIAVFAWRGDVIWTTGLILALGTAAGGWIGSHVAVRKGEGAIRVVLYIALIALAVSLLAK